MRTGQAAQQRGQLGLSMAFVTLVLAGLFAAFLGAGTASAATIVAAETRVGAHNVAVEILVETPQDVRAGQRQGKDAAGHQIMAATGVAANAAPEVRGGLNLFKHQSEQALRNSGWRDGDFFLKNDWKGSVKETWKGNSSLLRNEMRNGNPIYDSYVDGSGNLIPTGGFLNMERNVLINRGWTFEGSSGAWVP